MFLCVKRTERRPQDPTICPLCSTKSSRIRHDVTKDVLHALHTSTFLIELNNTFITLILKKKCPKTVRDFRLISLCNVLYKTISNVLSQIISSIQSTFVPIHFITDNILITNEILHFLRQKSTG